MSRPARGFTLIEMMIVVLVIGLLTAITLPGYRDHVSRSQRTAVKAQLAAGAQWMERWRGENNGVYTAAALPGALQVSPAGDPAPAYEIALTEVTAATWTLTATPRAGGPMASDVCGAFTIAHDGRRTAAGTSTGSTYERCWMR